MPAELPAFSRSFHATGLRNTTFLYSRQANPSGGAGSRDRIDSGIVASPTEGSAGFGVDAQPSSTRANASRMNNGRYVTAKVGGNGYVIILLGWQGWGKAPVPAR